MSLLFDDLTTIAINVAAWQSAKTGEVPNWMQGWQIGGVSRVLSVSYLRPVFIGEKILISCEVVGSLGRRLGK